MGTSLAAGDDAFNRQKSMHHQVRLAAESGRVLSDTTELNQAQSGLMTRRLYILICKLEDKRSGCQSTRSPVEVKQSVCHNG